MGCRDVLAIPGAGCVVRQPAHSPEDQPMRCTTNTCAYRPSRAKTAIWHLIESSFTFPAVSTAWSTRMTCTSCEPTVGKPKSACVLAHRSLQQADRRNSTAVRAIRIRQDPPRTRRQHRPHQAPPPAGRRQGLGAQARTAGEPRASDCTRSARRASDCIRGVWRLIGEQHRGTSTALRAP
jgi:hypothetical protein